jgi:hypothetical protein
MLVPMKMCASTGMPASWEIRTIGSMSAVFVRPGPGAGRAYAQACAGDFLCQAQRVRAHFIPRRGQADVRDVDAQLLHEVKDPELFLNGRRLYRRGLKAVAERFIVEFDRVVFPVEQPSGILALVVEVVPGIDEVAIVEYFHRSCLLLLK